MNVRFVIDETCWQFDHVTISQCCIDLDSLLDQIEQALNQRHGVCYSEELFYQPVWHDKTFYDLLAYDSGFHIPQEIYERLASLIYRLPKWEELELQNGVTQLNSDEGSQATSSIDWALHKSVKKDMSIACLVLTTSKKIGLHNLPHNNRETPVWFVADNLSYQGFFRWLIIETSKQPTELEQFAVSAFFNLEFRDDVFHGIKDMSKPYIELVDDLVRHLAALSDHGLEIFSKPWDQATSAFGNHKVNLSSENGNTKSNARAKKQRTYFHNGKEFTFWWHSKLSPDRDRIHFCPNDANTNQKILIGIFCQHLT